MIHISKPMKVASDFTVIGKNIDGDLVSVTGYLEHYQFTGPMDGPDENGNYLTDDDTLIVYTFRDQPRVTIRWGDLMDTIPHAEESA